MKYEWTSKLKNVTYDPTSKEYSWSEEQTEIEPYPILTDDIIQQGRLYEFTTNHKDFRIHPHDAKHNAEVSDANRIHQPTLPTQSQKTKENKK